MAHRDRTVGLEEAGTRFAGILEAANRDGLVTIITRRGIPYAAVGPVPAALGQGQSLSGLRASAGGCFGDAGAFVREMRDDWS